MLFFCWLACSTLALGDAPELDLTAARSVGRAVGVAVVVPRRAGPLFGEDRRQLEPPRGQAELDAALATLQTELSRYPKALLSSMVHEVHLGGRVVIEGGRREGTSTCRDGGMLAVSHHEPTEKGQRMLAMSLHHELGHLVMCSKENREAWKALVTEAPVAGAGMGMGPTEDPALLSKGFVTAYGASAASEDFPEYANLLLTRPAALATRAEHFPRVRRKADFVAALYAKAGVDLRGWPSR